MKETTKRYIISSVVTFFTAMALVIIADIDSLTMDSIKQGALVGLSFTALRAGIKAVLEYLVSIGK